MRLGGFHEIRKTRLNRLSAGR
jgi:hypothetical protein